MLALGIDTATPMVSVSLVQYDVPVTTGPVITRPPRAVARQDRLVHNAHGEVLAGLIAAVLAEAAYGPGDLDTIGVGLGPGPFTGLRAGIVTAAAMSDALGVPAYGMCSLDAIALPFAMDENPFVVVTDARRRQVYWAVYSEMGTRIEGPDISEPADLAAHLRGRIDEVTGSVTSDHREAFAGFHVSEPRWPDSAVIASRAVSRRARDESPTPLTPMYLRRPDARPPRAPKKVTPR